MVARLNILDIPGRTWRLQLAVQTSIWALEDALDLC